MPRMKSAHAPQPRQLIYASFLPAESALHKPGGGH